MKRKAGMNGLQRPRIVETKDGMKKSLFNEIIKCKKCLSLGIDYRKERKENLKLAYHFLPKSIKVLWILESPPESYPPRYFYRSELTQHDDLYREVMKCLGIEPANPKTDGLHEFQRRGHFLIDLAKCPVDKDNSPLKPQMIENCSELFRREVLGLRPEKILIVKSPNYDLVSNRLKEIGFGKKIINDKPIPYPGSGQQVRFREAISKYLQ